MTTQTIAPQIIGDEELQTASGGFPPIAAAAAVAAAGGAAAAVVPPGVLVAGMINPYLGLGLYLANR